MFEETTLSIATGPAIESRKLNNGLTVLWQPMPWLRTAAYTMWLPGGITAEVGKGDDDDRRGLASLTVEMMQRGAGAYSSRQFVAAEDNLGIDSSGTASTSILGISGSMPSDSLGDSIGLLAALVRRPHLPGDQFEDAKMMLRQEMLACQDEPTQRLMRRLRQKQYGEKLGRSGLATSRSIETLSIEDVRQFYEQNVHASGAILAIAGNIDAAAINAIVDENFGDWQSGETHSLPAPSPIAGHEHIQLDSSQTHIGLSFDNIAYGDPQYFIMRAGIGILSDGMSSRLFDRVREQHGLCYSIWANTHSLPVGGAVFGYAGTTPQRAQQTLDLTLQEISGLAKDLQPSELDRWKVRIQSSLIMEQESAGSRAGSLAADQFQVGRVIPTEQLETIIESIKLEQIEAYYQANPPGDFRIVTVGPEPLKGGVPFTEPSREATDHE